MTMGSDSQARGQKARRSPLLQSSCSPRALISMAHVSMNWDLTTMAAMDAVPTASRP
jgi:hypothetical protein